MARSPTATLLAIAATLAAGCAGRRSELPRLARPRAAERILIVAPHVDDESIAAAGYTADAVAAGADVFFVYLTAGDGGRGVAEIEGRTWRPRPKDFRHEGEVRLAEALAASNLLGVQRENVFFLGYPDGDLESMLEHPDRVITSRATGDQAVPYAIALSPGAPYRLANLEADLDRVLTATSPSRVLAPVPFNAHPDHSAGGRLARRLLSRRRDPPQWLGYLVHARGFPAPLLFAPRDRLLPPARLAEQPWLSYPLSAQTEARKRAALRLYASQREEPYLLILLDAFVRTNELFVTEPSAAPFRRRDAPEARQAPAPGRGSRPAGFAARLPSRRR